MNRIHWSIALTFALVCSLGWGLSGTQEKKGPNVQDPLKGVMDSGSESGNKDATVPLKVSNSPKALKTASILAQTGKVEPVKSRLVQVFADHEHTEKLARSKDQRRAVLLIHGYRVEDSFAEARLVEWQKAGSKLVIALGKNADVFAFVYGQDASLEKIAEGPNLRRAVDQLKKLEYSEIVLLGHGAGGILARMFVEDHAVAEVSKVIQVCSPNGGSQLADFWNAHYKGQEAFHQSLKPKTRALVAQTRKDKKLPTNVQFVCVVGKVDEKTTTDCVVDCSSQWSHDLRRQGVPARELLTDHFSVMTDEAKVNTLAKIILEKHPRWNQDQVLDFAKKFPDVEVPRGVLVAVVQTRADKAQQDRDALTLIECARTLAPYPQLTVEKLPVLWLEQAAQIALAQNKQQDAVGFLEMAGAHQVLLDQGVKNKVMTLAVGKHPDELLKGEVIACLGPINKVGKDLFDPDVAPRGAIESDIAAGLGKALVLAVRPTANIDKMASYKIGPKKLTETSIDVEMDFHGGAPRYRARMTIVLAYEKGRARIVSASYQDDWLVPWERARIEEFKSRFNGK